MTPVGSGLRARCVAIFLGRALDVADVNLRFGECLTLVRPFVGRDVPGDVHGSYILGVNIRRGFLENW